jgi:hypothetical protein
MAVVIQEQCPLEVVRRLALIWHPWLKRLQKKQNTALFSSAQVSPILFVPSCLGYSSCLFHFKQISSCQKRLCVLVLYSVPDSFLARLQMS